MLTLAVQFVLGLLYANAGEWLVYKYILHAPIFLIFPLFISAVYAPLALNCYKHRKAHLDPVWARRHLRWHYEHHLGGNACVKLVCHLAMVRLPDGNPVYKQNAGLSHIKIFDLYEFIFRKGHLR